MDDERLKNIIPGDLVKINWSNIGAGIGLVLDVFAATHISSGEINFIGKAFCSGSVVNFMPGCHVQLLSTASVN
jgi:hypothetical protein